MVDGPQQKGFDYDFTFPAGIQDMPYAMYENGKMVPIAKDSKVAFITQAMMDKLEVNRITSYNVCYTKLLRLKGAICIDEARKTKNTDLQKEAVAHLTKAAIHWKDIISSTEQYNDVPLLHIKTVPFSYNFV